MNAALPREGALKKKAGEYLYCSREQKGAQDFSPGGSTQNG